MVNSVTEGWSIYYATLPSNIITNCIAPGYRYVSGDPSAVEERQKAQEAYLARKNAENNFYNDMEQSIKEIGIRNPILIQAGFCVPVSQKYLPIEAQEDHSKILCCDRNGGSRLWFAQKLDMDVTCIISDFCERFVDSGFEELYTEADIMSKYPDKPKRIIINDHGVHVQDLPHIQGKYFPSSLED